MFFSSNLKIVHSALLLCGLVMTHPAQAGDQTTPVPTTSQTPPPQAGNQTTPVPTMSQTPPPQAGNQTPSMDLRPIDTLQQDLSKVYASKTARLLKNAYEALQNKKFSVALGYSSKAIRDEQFSDYGLWISALASRGLAQDSLDRKQFAQSLKLLQKSISLLSEIETRNPYSPLLRDSSKELALSEALLAQVYLSTKRWKTSEQFYEKAFQRLQSQGKLHSIGFDSIHNYAKACNKQLSPLCMGWLRKLYPQFSKNPEQKKLIETYFPSVSEKITPNHSASKTTLTYKSPDLDQVAFDSVMKIYLDEKFGKAETGFRKFLDEFPRSSYRFRARYWLAQSLYHENEDQVAQKLFGDLVQESPLHYYGLLSSIANDKGANAREVTSAINADLPMATDKDPSLLPHEVIHIKRGQHFLAEQAYELAAIELKDQKARDEMSSPFLLYLAMLNYKARNHNNSFQIITELIQRKYEGIFSPYGLRLIFPTDFIERINKYSELNGLDPILVLSLIKQESAFNEDANSSVGAMGLMQLMPYTAIETDPKVSLASLVKAEDNIRVGTLYLKKLFTRFNGNIVLAVAGYNAGPNAVDRWVKDKPEKREMLEFIESIPYKETREYVMAILRNYYWYSRRLNPNIPYDLNYFWKPYTLTR